MSWSQLDPGKTTTPNFMKNHFGKINAFMGSTFLYLLI